MSNFTWDSSPEIHLKSIQDLKQKYNRHYMRTLEKMTSHSAKIPIKSLAEYCFLLAAGIVKHQKRLKYIYKTSCCWCRSAVRCSASSHRERADSHLLQVKHWQGISTSHNLTSEDPDYHFKGSIQKKMCVSANISMSESPLGPKIEYWEVLFTPENEVLWDIFVEKWNAIIKVGF